jgi:ADP-ribose pyrophosphatase YjhB (NUDIX family)
MNFCSQCAAPLTLRVPDGDHLPRHVCTACGAIHYQNPKIVAGCIPEWDGRLLFCRRAIEPRYGLWTLPAGFMENGETTPSAAAREAREEACAEMDELSLFGHFNLPHINQVYILFRGVLRAGYASPGHETLEVAMLREEETPWEDLAFPVIRECLKLYYADRHEGVFHVHMTDIVRLPDGSYQVGHHDPR